MENSKSLLDEMLLYHNLYMVTRSKLENLLAREQGKVVIKTSLSDEDLAKWKEEAVSLGIEFKKPIVC